MNLAHVEPAETTQSPPSPSGRFPQRDRRQVRRPGMTAFTDDVRIGHANPQRQTSRSAPQRNKRGVTGRGAGELAMGGAVTFMRPCIASVEKH